MAAPHALVSGASIAGLSTAYWLGRAGWQVDVVERFPAFRDGGQNVDIRGAAREALRRMGLEEAVRSRTTTEEGTAVLDATGRAVARFPVEDPDGPTAELEILRGDLARVILDALPAGVSVRYDTRIAEVLDDDSGLTVRFGSGELRPYDIVVVAEGVRSATRDLIFGPEVTRRELGVTMTYGTIPRAAGDDRWWRWYSAPGGRQITLRPDNAGTTRATLAHLSTGGDDLDRVFHDAGWQARRVLDGFAASADVYVDQLTQIMMPAWSKGRVCVTGDAAWCVTPLGGGGTSLALLGGYVLAAFLSRTEHGAAFAAYEQWMRPLTEDAQKLPPGTPGLFYPTTTLGVRALRLAARAGSTAPLRKLTARIGHVARTTRPLPEPAA